MNLEAVIFDLDLTLIASSSAEALRKRRAWPEVYGLIPTLQPYEGVAPLLSFLQQRNIKTAIVTSSPSSYCNRVIGHWKFPVTTTVCYHDTTHRKPHAEPMVKALEKLKVGPERAIAVGDMPADIVSAREARIFSIAALWGSADPASLLAVKPDLALATVAELVAFIETRIG